MIASKSPKILFIPVSSLSGSGEYYRSLILAEEFKRQYPTAEIHFILNQYVSYAKDCPFPTHFSEHSATKDTNKVKQVINELLPDLVIFDCSGRSAQFKHAKKMGAKVIFLSQHKKKRARGLKLNRLPYCDLHWVIQPSYTIPPLSLYEKLKLKLYGKPFPKNIGSILPKITEKTKQDVLDKYGLIKDHFFIFNSGSGGHKVKGEFAADLFYLSAVCFTLKKWKK